MASASLSLFDNDIPTVNLIAGNDPNEAGPTAGTFLFTLDQAALTDITLFYTVNPTAATPGTDYLPLTGNITVPAGQTSVSLSVIPLDDDLADPNETINISLNSAPAYTPGTSINATLTIFDNDTAGITLNPLIPLTTTEAGAGASPTLRLNTQPIADVILTLTSSDPSEGIVTPTTLTFTPAKRT